MTPGELLGTAWRFAAREAQTIARGATGGAIAAVVFVGVDVAHRTRWGPNGVTGYVTALLGLAVVAGVLLAAGLSVIGSAAELTVRPSASRRRRRLFECLVAVSVGAALAAPSRSVVLHGQISTTSLPVLVPYAAWVTAAIGVAFWRTALTTRSRARRFVARAAAWGAAMLLLAADARLFPGRHRGAHLTIEAFAFVLLVAPILRWQPRRRGVAHRAAVGVGVALLACIAAIGSSRRLRERELVALRHLDHEPSTAATLYGLLRKDREAVAIAPKWTGGEPETPSQAEKSASLRNACTDCNVIVYFVDTLRADVATDPDVMPNATQFARSAIRFSNTYSTASDTLSALPTLLGGRYDGATHASVLSHVRAKHLDNALFIASSADEYLKAQLPAFQFDFVETVADHRPDQEVWGYGADVPTGDRLTERAIAWMRERQDRRFFAWIYNFDLHGWRALRNSTFTTAAETEEHPEDRYRGVAQMVDRSLGALLDGISDLGLADKTIVVFVSDHGEALGYRGFWTHSTFLWEPLVRVPLAIRVPGIEPRPISRPTSIVDVTPTLARFLDPYVETSAYHGVDLLRFYADPDSNRGLPLLLQAHTDGHPSVVGVVVDDRKLVVNASGGEPQLHDLSKSDPDDTDLVLDEPDHAAQLLDEIVRSPLLASH